MGALDSAGNKILSMRRARCSRLLGQVLVWLAVMTLLASYAQPAIAAVAVARTLSSVPGVRIDGAFPNDGLGGWVTNAGDVNGDGRKDALIGADHASLRGPDTGSAYVVFGRTNVGTIDLASLDPSEGYRIEGASAGDFTGISVANAGDVDGDGHSDALIGTWGADNNNRNRSGSVYVVFGQETGTSIDLAALTPSQGYRIDGESQGDNIGVSVAGAGDVNGDGVPDALIGARDASMNGRFRSGSAYVVFGRSSGDNLDLAAMSVADGYRIDGAAAGDNAGESVSNAKDVNSDRIPDAYIGAFATDSNARVDSGSVYVVLGQTGASKIDLAVLDPSQGIAGSMVRQRERRSARP